jgi:hypothetical protein
MGDLMKITNFKYLSADREKKIAELDPVAVTDGVSHFEVLCPITRNFICSFSLKNEVLPVVAPKRRGRPKKD